MKKYLLLFILIFGMFAFAFPKKPKHLSIDQIEKHFNKPFNLRGMANEDFIITDDGIRVKVEFARFVDEKDKIVYQKISYIFDQHRIDETLFFKNDALVKVVGENYTSELLTKHTVMYLKDYVYPIFILNGKLVNKPNSDDVNNIMDGLKDDIVLLDKYFKK